MIERYRVHTATVGTVSATVHHIPGFQSTYEVTLQGDSAANGQFWPEELKQLSEAAEQARLFICLQEQISRMNSCPGCGD
jgi:hypothetical protein